MIAPANRDGTAAHTSPVLLVVPPFQGLKHPALGPSQLKANLERAGIPCEVLYLNLLFAERISPYVHEWLSGTGPALVGEFVFSGVVHDLGDQAIQRFVDEIVTGSDVEPMLREWYPGATPFKALRALVEEARNFIEIEAMREIEARNPWLVGFSSTFQANCCSLATIRQLKRVRPDIMTVMGGANCETVMGEELMSLYPDIDFVGRGECDRTFVEFALNLRAGGDGAVPGFITRAGVQPPSSALHGHELDDQPHPDFDDYFTMLKRVECSDKINVGLAMEASRGCWWGFKQHCTFCAFNRDGMVFRAKEPQRVLDEMRALVDRYGVARMEMADNILDMQYFRNVVPTLAAEPIADIFWESKANLSRSQVRALAKARVTWLQPGIESLCDSTLKLMKKGATGLQNLQLLKWGTESGMKVTWNWLFGFPGEDDAELDQWLERIELTHHLQAPVCSPVIYLERFSPYHAKPEDWGIKDVRAAEANFHVYPHAPESVDRLAFFFEGDYFKDKTHGPAHRRLMKAVERWNWAHATSHLIALPIGATLYLLDTRVCKVKRLHKLRGLERSVYEHLYRTRGLKKILKAFEDKPADEVISALRALTDAKLVLAVNERYLALGTDPRFAYRQFPAIFPGGQFVARKPRTLGSRLRAALSSPRTLVRDTVTNSLFALLRRLPEPVEPDDEEKPVSLVPIQPGEGRTRQVRREEVEAH